VQAIKTLIVNNAQFVRKS